MSIKWLEPGFERPDGEGGDFDYEKTWTVWADMTGTVWEMDNGSATALVVDDMPTVLVYNLVDRLYQIHGDRIRYGLEQD